MKTFKHSGSIGDIIASIPTINELAKGEKVVLYLQPNVLACYPPNMKHPSGKYRMSLELAEKVIPLLQTQPIFSDVKLFANESIDFDLDLFRCQGFNLAAGNLARYYCLAFPVCPNLWEPWMDVEPDERYRGAILVNRTQRYQNPTINYRDALRPEWDVRFLGLHDELYAFRQVSRLNMPHVCPKTFLETARAIKACRLFIGNQSSSFWLAEAMKTPRVLEVFPHAPNVSPCGPNGFEFYNQEGLLALLDLLL